MLQHYIEYFAASDKGKLIYNDQPYTLKQIAARAFQIIEEINQLNIPKNGCIAFCMPNSPELLCWYLACFYLGITIVPIIYELDAEHIEQVVELTKPSILFITSEKQVEINTTLACDIYLNDKTYETVENIKLLTAPVPTSNVSSEKVALIIFTSGSTGMIKGIQHSYQSMWGFMQTLIEALSISKGLTYLVAQPMGHIGGIATTLITLIHEGTAILLEYFEITSYIKALQTYQPTHINLHTPLYYDLLDFPKLDRKMFSKAITCFAGGDTIPHDLPENFTQKTGALMQIGYGMTETGIVMLNQDPYNNRAGSTGKKLSQVSIELRNHDGKIVNPGTTGEIWVKSPGCCIGYYGEPELNKASFCDGWFRTHDQAFIDTLGYYWYQGRNQQIIHFANYVIYPQVIEDALFDCPEVHAACVLGKKDERNGEIPVAFIELKPHQNKNNIEDVITHNLSKKLKSWQMPQKIVVVDKLPLNLTGKIDREKLVELI